MTFDNLEYFALQELRRMEQTNPAAYARFMEYFHIAKLDRDWNPDYADQANIFTGMLNESGQPPAFYLFARMRLLTALSGIGADEEYIHICEAPDLVRATDTISEEDLDFLFAHHAVLARINAASRTGESADELASRVDNLIEKYGAYSAEAVDVMFKFASHLQSLSRADSLSDEERLRLAKLSIHYAEKAGGIVQEVKANPSIIEEMESLMLRGDNGNSTLDVEQAHINFQRIQESIKTEAAYQAALARHAQQAANNENVELISQNQPVHMEGNAGVKIPESPITKEVDIGKVMPQENEWGVYTQYVTLLLFVALFSGLLFWLRMRHSHHIT